MKTKLFLFIMLFGLMFNVMAQEKPNCTKEMKNDFKVTVKDVNEIHMVYYEFTGPYVKSFDDFGKLMEYMQKNKLPMGSNALGIFYDDPAVVPEDKLRSESGYMVTGKVEVSDGYKYKKLDACKAVSVWYYSMDEIYPAYGALAKYIEENNLITEEYSVEIYHGDDPEKIEAEILMIIKE